MLYIIYWAPRIYYKLVPCLLGYVTIGAQYVFYPLITISFCTFQVEDFTLKLNRTRQEVLFVNILLGKKAVVLFSVW